MSHRVRRDPLVVYTTMDVTVIRGEFNRLFKGALAAIAESAF